jgi:O-antigen/teichoic acid export membrane protein
MMLPSLFGLAAAAQYGAAFRVLMFAFIPLQSLMTAFFPRFFQEGGQSLDDSVRLWRRTAPISLAYALPTALLLYLCAPWIQTLLGPEFTEVADVLRLGVWLLILLAFYQPLGDALTGADFLAYRSLSLLVAVACNLGLNLWLIPAHGWRGALVAAYLSHLLLLVLYVVRVRRAPPVGRVAVSKE